MAGFKYLLSTSDSNDMAQYDRLAAQAKSAGFNALGASALAEPTIEQLYDPEDAWLQFVITGLSLMKITETALINGVLSKGHLEKNAALLAEKSKILARHGIKGALGLLEPQILPKWFYEKNPEIKGPACYNPCLARKRYYSPCIDRPEVLQHYREAVRKVLELAPEIGVIRMFTNDSGAGICWCSGLYPGPNGPDACRDVAMGERIRGWLEAIIAGAADAGRDVEVMLRPLHFGRDEIYSTIDNLPRGARLVFKPSLYPSTPFIAEDTTDYIARSKLRKHPAALELDPALSYPLGPLASAPLVYFALDSLREAAAGNVRALVLGCLAGPVDGADTPEKTAIVAATARPPKNQVEIDAIVSRIARDSVGTKLAAHLVSAWRDVDSARLLWPNVADTNHLLYPYYSVMGDRWLTRPLVPAPHLLSDRERQYYSEGRHRHLNPKARDGFFISEGTDNYNTDEFKWLVAIYDLMMRYMDRAVGSLEGVFGKLEGAQPEESRRFMHEYRRVAALRCVWRTQRNVLRCGSTIEFFTGEKKDQYLNVIRKDESFLEPATYRRLFLEAVDDEIENAKELIRLMDASDRPLINTGRHDKSFLLPHNVGRQMEKKIELMEAHKADIDVLFPNCPPETFTDPTYEWADRTTQDG